MRLQEILLAAAFASVGMLHGCSTQGTHLLFSNSILIPKRRINLTIIDAVKIDNYYCKIFNFLSM